MQMETAIAANRFGLGARPGELKRVDRNPQAWLLDQLEALPCPTVAAINGHAFGAGLMVALCHDVRVMREDRGFACANEMQIGFKIPTPELGLFRGILTRAL